MSEIEKGSFVEYAEVHNNLYGTSRTAIEKVLESKKICILDLDLQGAKSIKKTDLKSLIVFIKPPSLEDLKKRLHSRNTETEDQIETRIKNAKKDIKFYEENKDFFDSCIVNDELEDAYKVLKNVLFP